MNHGVKLQGKQKKLEWDEEGGIGVQCNWACGSTLSPMIEDETVREMKVRHKKKKLMDIISEDGRFVYL